MNIFCAAEDDLSYAVIEKIIRNEKPGVTTRRLDAKAGGFGILKRNMRKYINLSKKQKVLVITDLDQNPCAPILVKDWLDGMVCPPGLTFRVAVREIEAWVLSDREAIAEWMKIPVARIPIRVDEVMDPKVEIIRLAQKAKNQDVKRYLPPASGAKVGTGYNSLLVRFINNNWDIDRAKINSPSLKKAYQRIAGIKP